MIDDNTLDIACIPEVVSTPVGFLATRGPLQTPVSASATVREVDLDREVVQPPRVRTIGKCVDADIDIVGLDI